MRDIDLKFKQLFPRQKIDVKLKFWKGDKDMKKILIKYIVLFLQDMTEEQVKEVYAYTVMVADDTETCESVHRFDSESGGSKE